VIMNGIPAILFAGLFAIPLLLHLIAQVAA
jgi:hypothetical protein